MTSHKRQGTGYDDGAYGYGSQGRTVKPLFNDLKLLMTDVDDKCNAIQQHMQTYVNEGGGYPYLRLATLIEVPYAVVLNASAYFMGRPLADHEIMSSAEALRAMDGWKCELIGAVHLFEAQRRNRAEAKA